MDFRNPGPGFQSLFSWNLDSRFQSFAEFRIPDSLSCVVDSKAQDSGFHKQSFSGIPLHGAESTKNSLGMTHDVKSSWRVVPEAGFFSASLLFAKTVCLDN